ncbi:unnamed protein product [Phytomonas sp. Hart1]|nr:unnamed protein product [Phytomonas sp. Hart1]|eukprot:CCW67419.1 unnamed protein product [Phytomonas sp. isolate Hart1]
MAFTFAPASSAPNQAGMQNNFKPGTFSFSSTPSAPPQTMANTGFGTFNTGFMKPGGNFTSGTGINSNPIGVGYSGVGFPSSTESGSAITGLNPNAFGSNLTQQLPPYKGIKGPGYAPIWQNTVDFSQINDHTLFDSLPPTLQNHLMELHTFANKEEESIKAVTDYLNDIKPTGIEKNAAQTTKNVNLGSYRHQSHLLAELKGGNHAVSLLAVGCEHHEKEAQSFSQYLDQFESAIHEYQHRVWEPLLASGNLTRGKTNSISNSLNDSSSLNRNMDAKSPLFTIIEELQDVMRTLNNQIEELRMDVMPSLTSNSLVNVADSAKSDRSLGHYGPTAYFSRGEGRTPLYGNLSHVDYADRPDCVQYHPTFSPLNGTSPSTLAGSALGEDPAPPSEVVSHINTSLGNLFTSLMHLSSWADHLHKRSDTARGIFTRQYGQYEADVLFKPPMPSQETRTLAPIPTAAHPIPTTNPPPAGAPLPPQPTTTTIINPTPSVGGGVGGGTIGQGSAGLFGGGKTKPTT